MNGVTINVLSLPVVSPTYFEKKYNVTKSCFDSAFKSYLTINQCSVIDLMNTYRELIIDEFFHKIL